MTIETLIIRYGVAAIFVGAGVEGETSVVAGGVLAHRHLIPLWAAMAAASTGSFVADQLYGLGWVTVRVPESTAMLPLAAFAIADACRVSPHAGVSACAASPPLIESVPATFR